VLRQRPRDACRAGAAACASAWSGRRRAAVRLRSARRPPVVADWAATPTASRCDRAAVSAHRVRADRQDRPDHPAFARAPDLSVRPAPRLAVHPGPRLAVHPGRDGRPVRADRDLDRRRAAVRRAAVRDRAGPRSDRAGRETASSRRPRPEPRADLRARRGHPRARRSDPVRRACPDLRGRGRPVLPDRRVRARLPGRRVLRGDRRSRPAGRRGHPALRRPCGRAGSETLPPRWLRSALPRPGRRAQAGRRAADRRRRRPPRAGGPAGRRTRRPRCRRHRRGRHPRGRTRPSRRAPPAPVAPQLQKTRSKFSRRKNQRPPPTRGRRPRKR